MPAHKLKQFQALTAEDKKSILGTNPFMNDVPELDSKRYIRLTSRNSPLSLDGPDNPGDVVVSHGFNVTDGYTNSTQSWETWATASGATYNFALIGGMATLASHQLTWSDKTSFQTSNGHQQSATVTLTSSTVGFHDLIDVYEDTLYHTFLFASETDGNGIPPSELPSLSGRIERNGRPAANQLVTVTLPHGVVRRVFTNAQGIYRVYRLPSGKAKIATGGQTEYATIVPRKNVIHNLKPSQRNASQ